MQELYTQGISIVLLGDFNPKIFQPAWFASEELITPEEGEEAVIEIIHPEITRFTLRWLAFQVTNERFAMSTEQESSYEVLRDLIIGTFTLLRHTPIRIIGINTYMDFKINSENDWHAFGDKIAPKDKWGKILKKPGMRSLTMQSQRSDDKKGYIQVKVEPSTSIKNPFGIFFEVNDHYTVNDTEPVIGCSEIINILKKSWKESLDRSEKIIYSLLEE